MVRRKFRKRSRQKTKCREIRQSFQRHASSLKRHQSHDSNIENAYNPQQNSPESMLVESQHMDLLYGNKLSPEIVPKSCGIISAEICGHDVKIITDNIGAQKTEQSEANSNLSIRDFKCSAESADHILGLKDYFKHDIIKLIADDTFDSTDTLSFDLLFLNNGENKTANVTHNERSTVSAFGTKFHLLSTSQSMVFDSNVESRSLRDDVSIYTNEILKPGNPECGKPEMNGQQFLKEMANQDRSQKDHRRSMNDCLLIDKTLSMNDEFTREMNNYLNEQASTTIIRHSTFKTVHPIAILQSQPLSESAQLATCKSDKGFRASESDDVRLSLDEFYFLEKSMHESVDKHEQSLNNYDKRSRNILNGNKKRFDIVLKRVSKQLTVNWHEFRKIFARLNKGIDEDDAAKRNGASLLSRYRRFINDRRFPYVSISSTSSPLHTPSSSPKNINGRSSLADYNDNANARFLFAQSHEQGTEKTEFTIRDSKLVASCNCESSSAKHFCTVSTRFESEHEETERQKRSTTHAEQLSFPLLERKRKNGRFSSLPLNQPSCKTRWNSCSSESTSTSDFDQLAVIDYDSLQEVISLIIDICNYTK